MVGPPLIPPPFFDSEIDYIPSSDILAAQPDPRSTAISPDLDQPGRVLVQLDVEIPGPVLRAAVLTDIRILRGLLRYRNAANEVVFPATNVIVGPLHGPWCAALTEAIGANLFEHARLLLDHGALPDGFPAWCFRAASSRFVRGREPRLTMAAGCDLPDRPKALAGVIDEAAALDQGRSLGYLEMQERGHNRIARFWAETDFPRTDYPTNNPISALSAAIKVSSVKVYELLLQKGADESAWTDTNDGQIVEGASPSHYCMESPLVVAVKDENESMVRFLLDRGHRPDVFPMTLVTRCMSPLMLAITKHRGHLWPAGFTMLQERADMSKATPLFHCHILHFAIATLDMDAIRLGLDVLGGPDVLQTISPTALNHNLLHIASLPLDDSVVNWYSQPIYQSIHDVRTLSETWKPLRLSVKPRTLTASRGTGARGRGGLMNQQSRNWHLPFAEVSVTEKAAQEEVIFYLTAHLAQDTWWAQDYHGNTILHYLSSIRNPHFELLEKLRALPGGEKAYSETANLWGFTAKNLLTSGQAASTNFHQGAMEFWDRGN